MHAEDHDPSSGIPSYDLRGGFNAGQTRHRDVHHDNVWILCFGKLHCFATIRSFADYLELFILQLHAQAFAHYTMIVSQQYTDALHTIALLGTGISKRTAVPPRCGVRIKSLPRTSATRSLMLLRPRPGNERL